MNNCNDCEHKGICKFEEEFRNFALKNTTDIPDFIKVEIICKYFTEPRITPRKIDESPEYLKDTLITPRKYRCDGCSYYEEQLNGEIQIGDSPCQWCSKNPFHLTNTAGN